MKILHLSTYDVNGGAAKAAFRIFQAQKMAGLEVKMYCLVKQSTDPDVHAIDLKKAANKNFLADFLRFQKNYTGDKDGILQSDGLLSPGIVELINDSDADVVQLHWINYLLSIEDIQSISKPIVWYMHDQWPLGGRAHSYPDVIEDFMMNQGHFLNGNDEVSERKKRAFTGKFSRVSVPGPYLRRFVEQSPVFADTPVSEMPCPWINPVPALPVKSGVRHKMGLNNAKKYILFVNHVGPDNGSKGSSVLKQIVPECPGDWFFIIIGSVFPDSQGNNFLQPGNVDYATLSEWFLAADVLLMPSRYEVFSLVSQEAQMHGLPVVSYLHNGTSDHVKHMETGFLVNEYNGQAFSEGLKWVLNSDLTTRAEEIQSVSLEKVLPQNTGKAFNEIYASVLKQGGAR